jgi:hypothetical protein
MKFIAKFPKLGKEDPKRSSRKKNLAKYLRDARKSKKFSKEVGQGV